MPAPTVEWTDELVARLVDANARGLSATQMACELDLSSRNVVIGKLNRLGLKINPERLGPPNTFVWTPALVEEVVKMRKLGLLRREIAEKLNAPRGPLGTLISKLTKTGEVKSLRNVKDQARKSGVTFRFSSADAKPPQADLDEEIRPGEGKPFMALSRHDCRYPLGVDRWCAERAVEGRSYCDGCMALVYRRQAA